MERYFTSMAISEYLLDKGMTVAGTMRSDKAGITKEMKEKNPAKAQAPFMHITQIPSQCWFHMS